MKRLFLFGLILGATACGTDDGSVPLAPTAPVNDAAGATVTPDDFITDSQSVMRPRPERTLHGVLETVFAIGGVTSGYAIGGQEVEFQNERVATLAQSYLGQHVIAEGRYTTRVGVETGTRLVFIVRKILLHP